MSAKSIALSEDAFEALFPLIPNHLNPSAGWAWDDGRGFLFETYGDELDFVRKQEPRTIWTLVDGDDGDQYVTSGYHLVNRVGYLLSSVPSPEGVTIQVRIVIQGDNAIATETQHTPGPWDCDLDYVVAPDPNGRHPDIYIAEIAHSDEEGRVASDEQQHANRQLITAAPEMLEALLLAQRALNTAQRFRVGDTNSYHIATIVDNAIAKATIVNE